MGQHPGQGHLLHPPRGRRGIPLREEPFPSLLFPQLPMIP